MGNRRLRILRVLGEGGYSTVYLCRCSSTGEEFALKRILAQSSEQLELAKNEIACTSSWSHPNLLHLVSSDSKPGVVHLLFKAYTDGTVVDLVEKSQKIHPCVVLNIFLQVCRGETIIRHTNSTSLSRSRSKTRPPGSIDLHPSVRPSVRLPVCVVY